MVEPKGVFDDGAWDWSSISKWDHEFSCLREIPRNDNAEGVMCGAGEEDRPVPSLSAQRRDSAPEWAAVFVDGGYGLVGAHAQLSFGTQSDYFEYGDIDRLYATDTRASLSQQVEIWLAAQLPGRAHRVLNRCGCYGSFVGVRQRAFDLVYGVSRKAAAGMSHPSRGFADDRLGVPHDPHTLLDCSHWVPGKLAHHRTSSFAGWTLRELPYQSARSDARMDAL
jgi:hypothetical protein